MPEQSWRSHLKENDGGVLPVKFDVAKLKANLSLLPSGYELKKIDSELYDKCFENPETVDFVSTFGTKEKYLELGRGVVALLSKSVLIENKILKLENK